MECAPAFNYARSKHTTDLVHDDSIPGTGITQTKVIFASDQLSLDLRYVVESTTDCVPIPIVDLQLLDLTKKGHLGHSAYAHLNLVEGQAVTFILRTIPQSPRGHDLPTVPNAKVLCVGLDSKLIPCKWDGR
jgi:hypothetical protein